MLVGLVQFVHFKAAVHLEAYSRLHKVQLSTKFHESIQCGLRQIQNISLVF